MRSITRDLRYALRGIGREPSFTALAVLTLALGIGAGTTMFSVIHNVLFDPFPYRDAHRVVTVQIHDDSNARPGGRNFFQTPEFLDYQEQSTVFAEVIAGSGEDVLLANNDGSEQFTGGTVSTNMFEFLGVPPVIGRGLLPEDAKPDAPPVFVMAYKMWLSRFNLDPAIVGRTYVLNGVPTTLVGIMPKRFTKLAADLYRPVVLDRGNAALKDTYFMFQARLKPGVTVQQAAAETNVIAHRIAQTYPRNYPKQFTAHIVGWVDALVGQFGRTLYTMAAAVGLLLLIACGNVANMLLARGASREREIAIRLSLGAKRAKIVRQLLVESLVLAFAGALVGALFAYGGLKGLIVLIPDGFIPREADIRLNVPVLLFSMALAVITSLLAGLMPALQTARREMVEPLKDAGKGVSGGFRGGRMRNALVVLEVALSLVLLTGAGLLMRNFVSLRTIDLGINPDKIFFARLPLPREQYQSADAKQRFFESLLPRLAALPGVRSATTTTTLPPYGGIRSDIEVAGKPTPEQRQALCQLVSEGYFDTLGLKLLRGRTFTAAEVNGSRQLAVVNQTFATRYLGGEDPIGRMTRVLMLEKLPQPVANPVFEIIGVVADARNQGVVDPPSPEMFIPYNVTGMFERGILVRTEARPELLLNSARNEVWAVDRNVAMTLAGSLNSFLTQFTFAEPRFSLVLLGVFAGVGLALVAIGVYSVIAYSVSRQTQEIGIRMALGAQRASVLRMVFRSGLRLIVIGIVVGLVASAAATRVIASQLRDVSQYDPFTFASVGAVMLLAGVAACYVPARRATRVDPLVALRCE
ncbi:MAG: ABC transporter permease [Vicinamibacterales bacterium]